MIKNRVQGVPSLCRVVSWAKWFVKQVVKPGDICIDATVGNGNDTLFLAECVGTTGRVYGFDIQEAAIKKTKQKLAASGLQERVLLFQKSHTLMNNYLTPGSVKAVMFNLGYLPGGDHRLVTKPESTLQALKNALQLIEVGGMITVVSYTGHKGGLEEFQVLNKFLSELNSDLYFVLRWELLNQINSPPVMFVIQKVGSDDK
jgi:hypothetical protein